MIVLQASNQFGDAACLVIADTRHRFVEQHDGGTGGKDHSDLQHALFAVTQRACLNVTTFL